MVLGPLRGSGLLEGWVSLSRVQKVLLAQAEAEKIRKIGEAEAFVIEAIGMAEAEGMKLKAEALQQYGEAAKLALVLDALPEVRKEQLFPALAKHRGFPRLGQVSWGHREVPHGVQGPDPAAPWLSAHPTLLPCLPRSLPKWLLPSPEWMRSLFSAERATARCPRRTVCWPRSPRPCGPSPAWISQR